MKKSQFIAIFVLFVVASVLICIGCFLKNPGKAGKTAEETQAMVATLKPLETMDPTEVPSETPSETEEEATAEPTEEATAEPTGSTPLPDIEFPEIKNVDFVQYSSECTYFSTKWQTVNNQNKAVIYDNVLKQIKDIDYVFYTIESDTQWDIYMTFAMHYEEGYTDKVLDLLKENDIKAVFFVSYLYMSENPKLIKRMYDEGHIIGTRGIVGETETKKATAEDVAAEFLKIEELYREIIGKNERMYLYRTDYFSPRILKVAEAMGYTVVFRTYAYMNDYNEYKNQSVDALATRLHERASYNGSISEFSCEKHCYEALKIWIQYCKEENVNFRLIQRKH